MKRCLASEVLDVFQKSSMERIVLFFTVCIYLHCEEKLTI